ncbi:MAG TPA: hypothetical protein VFC51_03255 [Chloroflexota bacterium]|nr:hypothetical protein [Chloroflexota bacterium]
MPMRRRTRKIVGIAVAVATIATAGGGVGSVLGLMAGTAVQTPDALQTAVVPIATVVPNENPTPDVIPTMAAPPGAQPLPATSVGVVQTAQGGIAGTLPARVGCDADGLLRVETSEGTILAGVPKDGTLTCEGVVSQWQTVASSTGDVGIRYSPAQPGQPASMTLVSDAGRTLSLSVAGAWSAP